MSLQSILFRNDPLLQACLVSNPAHVTPGAKGFHVAKIQFALVAIDGAPIPDAERAGLVYGPATAAAVLAFKRKRDVVNRSYQSNADNIVGKMTIQRLDDELQPLEEELSQRLISQYDRPHPASPLWKVKRGQGMPIAARAAQRMVIAGDGDVLRGPLANYPDDLKAVILRSNETKVPGESQLGPFLAPEHGPKSLGELSDAFAEQTHWADLLKRVYAKMKYFGIWEHILTIESVWDGDGARGMFCDVFNHDRLVRVMKTLSIERQPAIVIPTSGGRIVIHRKNSLFCQDGFNVHGPRDTFREMVDPPISPGLHVCIPQPHVRGTKTHGALTDIHFDDIQQDQYCSAGFCRPMLDAATVLHLISVAPYLEREAKKWGAAHAGKLAEALKKAGAPPLPWPM